MALMLQFAEPEFIVNGLQIGLHRARWLVLIVIYLWLKLIKQWGNRVTQLFRISFGVKFWSRNVHRAGTVRFDYWSWPSTVIVPTWKTNIIIFKRKDLLNNKMNIETQSKVWYLTIMFLTHWYNQMTVGDLLRIIFRSAIVLFF